MIITINYTYKQSLINKQLLIYFQLIDFYIFAPHKADITLV